MKEIVQSKIMVSIRQSKLFHREEMQKLKPKDILKIIVIAAMIVIPLIVGLVI